MHEREGDHCLRGSLRGADVRAATEAVEGFLRGLEQYPAWVDGVSRPVAVEGGLRAYAVAVAVAVAAGSGSGDGLDLYLHSSGEDATQTLCHYSGEVAAIVRRAGGDGRLTWTQLPADRTDHLLHF